MKHINRLNLLTAFFLFLVLTLSCSAPASQPSSPDPTQGTEEVASIELDPQQLFVTVGEETVFHAVARDDRGRVIQLPASAFKWSSNPVYAVVDSSGFVGGISPGTTKVIASIGNISGSATLEVQGKPAEVSNIELQPSYAKIEVGQQYVFRAITKDGRGNINELPGSAFKWSSNPIYAVVDESGFVGGISPGITTVTAAIGDISGNATLEVVAKPDVPTRDIVGTWRGTGFSYFMEGPNKRYDRITWSVTLTITSVDGNTARGTLTLVDLKHENLQGGSTMPGESYGPDAIQNGQVGDSRLYFNVDDWRWDFTFTTDLMSGQFFSSIPSQCDPKSFTLTRQR